MKDERLEHLIDQHLSGTMSDAERRELEERLLHSATDRTRFWQMAETHVLLHEGAQRKLANPAAIPRPAAFQMSPRSFRLPWRPLTAAAAGVAFGVFCAAAAWAYVAPGMPRVVDHLLALADAGFEEGVAPLSEGIPVRFGVWSGDYAEVVGPQQGIVPREGRRMFRFLRSNSAVEGASGTVFNGNIYQLVDVRAWREAIASGTTVVDWSAWFNWAPGLALERPIFIASVWAFAGDPSAVRKNWEEQLHQELAYSSWRITADDDPRNWQRIAGSMIVPPDADFLVIELKAVPGNPAPVDGAVTFAGHYADDVRLVLRTNARQQPVARSSAKL